MAERQKMPQRARNVKIRHDEETRSKIKAAYLINRLQAYALGENEPDGMGGTRPCIMDSGQIRAAEILLRKILPDLQSVQVGGDQDAPLQFVIVSGVPRAADTET
jgi:hypothetical protein